MELSPDERQLLRDLLQQFLDAQHDIKDAMMKDTTTLTTFDDFVDATQEHNIKVGLAEELQERLIVADNVGGVHRGNHSG